MDTDTASFEGDLKRRKALLEDLGGISNAATQVKNSEWMYMLEEETRQSLSIEGYFATEKELKDVLHGRKRSPEILNYYRAAQSMYDLALQYYREEDQTRLDVPLVAHVHSELFRDLTDNRGRFRQASIEVQGARVNPPEFDIAEYIRVWNILSLAFLKDRPILNALTRIHTLFESIHPFSDGNGRVGRILLNYLGVSMGFPLIIIKGTDEEERQRYYRALETADVGFHEGFPSANTKAIKSRLEQGNFEPLERLFYENLLPRLDRVTAAALENQESLMELEKLAPHYGVKEGTLRQWVHRGKLIAVRRGRKLYSHPRLYLN